MGTFKGQPCGFNMRPLKDRDLKKEKKYFQAKETRKTRVRRRVWIRQKKKRYYKHL